MEQKWLQDEQGLVLKRLEVEDASALFKLVDSSRQRLREWLPWLDYNQTEADSLKFIQSTHTDASNSAGFVYGVWVHHVLAGVASIQAVNKANRTCNIGYWIGDQFVGKAIARRATSLLEKLAFEDFGLNRIEIRCATGNTRSQRIPEALGYSFEGVSRQCEWLYDHFVDHRVYSKLRSEYFDL